MYEPLPAIIVEKSPLDLNRYRYVKIGSNVACTLMQLEEHDDVAAFSLLIEAGNFTVSGINDDIPGLVSLTNRMLLRGSRNYPDSTTFRAHITAYDGEYSVTTKAEYTIFEFSCQADGFQAALEIFMDGLFFPLFSSESLWSEIQSLELEFVVAKDDDEDRLERLFCEVYCSRKHPARKPPGNTRSFSEHTDGKLTKALRSYHSCLFRGNANISYASSKNFTDMEDILKTSFAHWPSHIPACPVNPPLSSSEECQVVWFGGCSDELVLIWRLPFLSANQLSTVMWLIESKTSGYLYSRLLVESLASNVTAVEQPFDLGDQCTLLQISISLTRHGLENSNKVYNFVLSYMSSTNLFDDSLSNDLKMKRYLEWNSLPPPEATSQVALIVKTMRTVCCTSPEQILSHEFLSDALCTVPVEILMDKLQSPPVWVSIMDSRFTSPLYVEEHFNIEYAFKERPTLTPTFAYAKLYEANPLIARIARSDIKCSPSDQVFQANDPPELIRDDTFAPYIWSVDSSHSSCHIVLTFVIAKLSKHANEENQRRLFVAYVEELFEETREILNMADASFDLKLTEQGMIMALSADKALIEHAVHLSMRTLASILTFIQREEKSYAFESAKIVSCGGSLEGVELCERNCFETRLKNNAPDQFLGLNHISSLVADLRMLSVLTVGVERSFLLKEFEPELITEEFRASYLSAFNYDYEDLPATGKFVLVVDGKKYKSNCCYVAYYIGKDIDEKEHVTALLCEAFIDDDSNNRVQCSTEHCFSELFLTLSTESCFVSVADLIEMILEFVRELTIRMMSMTEEDFEELKKEVKEDFHEIVETPAEISRLYEEEIQLAFLHHGGHCDFKRRTRLLFALNLMTLNEFRASWLKNTKVLSAQAVVSIIISSNENYEQQLARVHRALVYD